LIETGLCSSQKNICVLFYSIWLAPLSQVECTSWCAYIFVYFHKIPSILFNWFLNLVMRNLLGKELSFTKYIKCTSVWIKKLNRSILLDMYSTHKMLAAGYNTNMVNIQTVLRSCRVARASACLCHEVATVLHSIPASSTHWNLRGGR